MLDLRSVDREPGYYWIAFSGPPEVAMWDGESWFVIGSETSVSDADGTVLSPRLEPPEGVRE